MGLLLTRRGPTSGTPRPAFALLITILALAALAAGCGGGSSKAATSGTTSTTTAGGSRASNRAKFTQCLESHGVPTSVASSFGAFRRGAGSGGAASSTTSGGSSTTSGGATGAGTTPSGTPRTRPTLPSQYSAAFTSCRSLLPAGGNGLGGFLNSPADAAYRNCLQVHGVTLPTAPTGSSPAGSVPSASAPAGATPGGGFANNPTFQAARQACASLLPAGQGRGTGSTSVTTTPAA